MKLKNLIVGVCTLCGFVISAAAELPAGYTQVASVTVDADTNFGSFLSGVAAEKEM